MKKLLSLVLAVAMVLGMTTVAFAADNDITTGNYKIIEQQDLVWDSSDTPPFAVPTAQAIDNAEFYDNDHVIAYDDDQEVFYFPILYSADAGTTPFAPIEKGTALARDLDVTAKVRVSSGSNAIEKVNTGYVKIKDTKTPSPAADKEVLAVRVYVSETLVSVKDLDFKAIVTLYSDGKKIKDSEVTIEGNVENYVQEDLDSDYDGESVSIEDGYVFEVIEYIKDLEIEVTEEISLQGRFFKKDYYVNYTQEPSNADADLIAKYDVENFYEFQTINIGGDTKVKFDYSDSLYAYTTDEEGALVYVGRTKEALPFYSKYFIATKELDLPAAEEPAVEEPTVEEPVVEEPADLGNETDGGDEVAEAPSEANNFNPGTGR